MEDHSCKFESRIFQMAEDIAVIRNTLTAVDRRINGSIDDIKEHIEHGSKWRMAIIGVAGMVILNIILFSYGYGNIEGTVKRNSVLIEKNIILGTSQREAIIESIK